MSSCGTQQPAPAPILLPVPKAPHLIPYSEAVEKCTFVIPDYEFLRQIDWASYKGISLAMTVPEVAAGSPKSVVKRKDGASLSLCLLPKDPPMNLGGLKPKAPKLTVLVIEGDLAEEIQSGKYQDSRVGLNPEAPDLYREQANLAEQSFYWVDLLAYLCQTLPIVFNDVSHSQIYFSDNFWITPTKPVYPDVPALFLEKGFIPTENSSENVYKLSVELGILTPQQSPERLFSETRNEAIVQWLVFQYQASLLDTTWKHGVERAQDMRIGKNYSLHENILKLLSQ